MHNTYKKWILNTYDRVKSEYVELDKLDQLVGDGDHGSTILKGVTIAKQSYLENLNSPLDETMATISKQMRIEMGGASGILMTIFFEESGKIDELNLTLSIIDIFEKSIEKIMKRGKVKAGDKSILDIYIPVLNFLQKNSDFQSKKNEINEILSLSLAKTKEMEARVGRAKFLEKKGLGFIDPGAKSTEIILREYFAAIL
ncbi:MAG: DAK2 domain-containing protein [Gammaproteobacteria bacterium]|mgnify:CR=1 FL=1|jgi:dihydroxyacetone kinase-like protein|tara:strand:- start:6792 stop:7391 length:600 start_codon:yes stop_codon:yes gene_type:complete